MDVKDIDFDELDRAVSSAIGNNKPEGVENPVATPVEPVMPVTPTLDLNPLTTIPVPVSRPAISRPSTGRFMDVVHPSSNMRSNVTIPERAAPRPFTAPISFMPITNPVSSPVNNTTVENNDLDIDKISDEIDRTLKIAPNDSQDSPFLMDAKVEKRPLNALASEQNTNIPSQPVDPIKFSSIGIGVEVQEKVDTPLPAELQNDLLSIEAGEVTKNNEVDVPDNNDNDELTETEAEEASPRDNPASGEEIEKQQISDNDSASFGPESSPIDSIGSNSAKPLVPTSIHQQYAELPNTGDREIGAIYDTNSYHTPMASPIKKKSGWMWVVWIALLMIVSVGAGVAVYFFVLPQL